MAEIYYVDGKFVQSDAAMIPVTDLAVLRGYGVFDFMRTYNRQPFHLEQHIERLFSSADAIGLEMIWTRDEITDIVMQTVEYNPHLTELNVRIVVTGGESADFITPLERPRLAVLCTQAVPPAEHLYQDGAKIITVNETRYIPQSKSINYIPAIRALREARQQNAVEAIYVAPDSRALEGTTTNLFIFQGGTLITPQEDILPGITRGVVLQLAEGVYPIDIRDIHLEELYAADEAFLSASNKQVMPIVQVDDRMIADGKPGPRTRDLMLRFGELTGVALIRA